MNEKQETPLEVVVLRGVDGYMAAVMLNGEWMGFYAGQTRTAATAQAVLAIADSHPS